MRLLTSSLKSIINAFLNGQLAPQGEGKGEGYRYALNANSTVGRVDFGAELERKKEKRWRQECIERKHGGVFEKLRRALNHY